MRSDPVPGGVGVAPAPVEGTPAKPTTGPGTAEAPRPGLSRITVIAIRCAAMVLNFGLQIVMARVMDLSAFGVANTALALLNILVIPAAFGYETAAIRFVALAREDQPLLRSLTARFAFTVAFTSLLTCLVVGAAAAVEYALGHDDAAIGMAFLVLIIPCFAFVRVGEAWLRGAGSLVRALINSGVVVPALTIAFIALEWVLLGGGRSVGVGGALGARALATGLAVAAVVAFVLGKLHWRLRPRREVEASMATEIRRTAVVLCGVSALAMVVTQSDIVAVSYIEGPSEAGVYSAAARIAQAMSIALVAVNFVLAPRIARLAADGETAQLQHDVSAAATWSTCVMVAGFAILVPGSSLVLSIFGSGFDAASDPLRILMVGQLVNALCGPAVAVLTMSGGQVQAMRVLGASAIVQLLLFALLIPPFGLVGAACATTVCWILLNLGMLVYVRRRLAIWSLPGILERALP